MRYQLGIITWVLLASLNSYCADLQYSTAALEFNLSRLVEKTGSDAASSCTDLFRTLSQAKGLVDSKEVDSEEVHSKEVDSQEGNSPETEAFNFRKAHIGQLRPQFRHNSTYTFEVGDQSKIHDQCALGTCTIQSWTSWLEQHAQVPVSSEYLSAQLWLASSLAELKADTLTADVQLGGNAISSRNRVRQFGIIPPSAWKGGTDFQNEKKRLSPYVENIIARAKWERDQQTDPTVRNSIMEKARGQIQAILEEALGGKLPTEFQYENKSYTPQSFARAFFPEIYKPLLLVYANDDAQAPTTLRGQVGSDDATMETTMENVEAIIVQLLEQQKNVSLSYDHQPEFVDKKTGIMSISAFEHPAAAEPVSRAMRKRASMPGSGHAVQIVGYDLDPHTGRVIKWKIKNSWGEDVGDHGYFHMYADYFEAFVKYVSFFPEPNVELPRVDQIIPTQLPLGFPKLTKKSTGASAAKKP